MGSGKRVVFRADDAGGTEGANEAILQTVESGPVRNISVMAPGAALEHAAKLLASLEGVAIGLHVTLNSEWDEVRWGPILDPSAVPSLVEPDGTFTRRPSDLQAKGFVLAEAVREVEAQLARLRAVGFQVDYLDEHMMVGGIDGLGDELARLAEREGLVFHHQVPYLRDSVTSDVDSFGGSLINGPDEPFVVVTHPMTNLDPVARRFTFEGIMPGEILRERAQERRVLTDPRINELIRSGHIRSLTYREALS